MACRAGAPLSLSCYHGQLARPARATSGIIHVMLGGCGRAEGVFDCLHQFPPKVEGCRSGNVRNIAIGGQEPQRNALCVLQLYSETVCLESLRQSGRPIHCPLEVDLSPAWFHSRNDTAVDGIQQCGIMGHPSKRASKQASEQASLAGGDLGPAVSVCPSQHRDQLA